LLLVGDGPQRSIAIDAQNSSGGVIRWLGARHGREKVGLITLSQVFLNPGLVGLGILDSFVCGVPMVTTSDGLHSPEISYLEDGINGVMVSGDVRAYASAVVALLADPGRLAHLREGCFRSAENVSLEDMASRFCVGIDDCLRHLGTHSEHAAERTYG
jgi:glycosyltransferase involved in cell wall biosynthesis